jgi:A/G-specific adenine glycosylase
MPRSRLTRKKSWSPQRALLGWYDVHRRELPWRARPGEKPDPYRVWLSEIMLQQTTVATVRPYYSRFLARWPTLTALAGASLDEILAAWSGLGYYARARNLHRAAKTVVAEYRGVFPSAAANLRQLPGVGAYTAGAIAAIAFDEREAAMDANAERVIARFFAIREPMPAAKAAVRRAGQSLVPKARPGDFAQALMDLGASVCTPRQPVCGSCPWEPACRGRHLGIAADLPTREAERKRPLKRGAAFVARDSTGAVLLVRRPTNGLLGAMMQPPLGPWTDRFPCADEAFRQAPFSASWTKRPGVVTHGFTHFELEIEAYYAELSRRHALTLGAEHLWVKPGQMDEVALPTVMRKIIVHALKDAKVASAQVRSARKR